MKSSLVRSVGAENLKHETQRGWRIVWRFGGWVSGIDHVVLHHCFRNPHALSASKKWVSDDGGGRVKTWRKGVAVGIFVAITSAWAVGYSSPHLLDAGYANLGAKVDFVWAANATSILVWAIVCLPEVRGRSLEGASVSMLDFTLNIDEIRRAEHAQKSKSYSRLVCGPGSSRDIRPSRSLPKSPIAPRKRMQPPSLRLAISLKWLISGRHARLACPSIARCAGPNARDLVDGEAQANYGIVRMSAAINMQMRGICNSVM